MEDTNPEGNKVLSSAPSEGEAQPEVGETQPKGRTAEDRINELLSKNKETLERLERAEGRVEELELRQVPAPQATPQDTTTKDPKVKEAVSFLKSEGKFVDEDYVEKRLRTIQDRMIADSEHQRLENLYDGEDGRPKYDRLKIEEYARKTGVWNFPAAYDQLYKDELFDWTVKKMESDRKQKPYVARPSSTQGSQTEENTITREKISGWLKTPEGRTKYEQNRGKILKLMAEGKL